MYVGLSRSPGDRSPKGVGSKGREGQNGPARRGVIIGLSRSPGDRRGAKRPGGSKGREGQVIVCLVDINYEVP